MRAETEGIVLRETKTSYNRRMLLLFTRDHGIISAGTSLGERGKTKSSLALQHFTYGRYSLHRSSGGYNVDYAEVIRSFYKIGDDIDKYLRGAYVLEFTAKAIEEEVPMGAAFDLLVDFFDLLEKRKSGFGTLVLAYQIKLFGYLGVMPKTDRCAICGKPLKEESQSFLSVVHGGYICCGCAGEIAKVEGEKSKDDTLIYSVKFDTINALKYFKANSFRSLENIALNGETGKQLQGFVRKYAAYHLDVSNIKSEKMI